jgi:hypothetical protein
VIGQAGVSKHDAVEAGVIFEVCDHLEAEAGAVKVLDRLEVIRRPRHAEMLGVHVYMKASQVF